MLMLKSPHPPKKKQAMLATGLTRFQKQQNHNQSALVSMFLFGARGQPQELSEKHGVLMVSQRFFVWKYDGNVLDT